MGLLSFFKEQQEALEPIRKTEVKAIQMQMQISGEKYDAEEKFKKDLLEVLNKIADKNIDSEIVNKV